MADTQRTRASVLALFADNVTGNVSAQDLRDWVVTMMESEFANPGDYWKEPAPRYITTDRTVRGWLDYSQIILSDCSFGMVLALTPSGTWRPADAANSGLNPGLGVAYASYLAGESQAIILRKGLLFLSNLSALFSGFLGRPVYLASGAAGSVAVVKPTNAQLLGIIEPADVGSTGSLGKWRFEPDWGVVGA